MSQFAHFKGAFRCIKCKMQVGILHITALNLRPSCFKHFWATFWSHFMVGCCLISWSCQEHKAPSSWGLAHTWNLWMWDHTAFDWGYQPHWVLPLCTLGTESDWHRWKFEHKTRITFLGYNYRTRRIKMGCLPLHLVTAVSMFHVFSDAHLWLSDGVSHTSIKLFSAWGGSL